MLRKRLLVLAVLLCSLAFFASERASAGAWCSCAATSCGYCEAECYPDPGTTEVQIEAAAWSCCTQNWKGIGCGEMSAATSPGGGSQ